MTMTTPNTTTAHTDAPSFTNHAAELDKVAHRVADRVADRVTEASAAVPPMVERLADRAGDLARQSAHTLTDGTQQVKVKFEEVSSSAIAYVKDEPVRAMLMAAGVGAMLMLVARAMTSHRH
jgi:ElaB/YqjD/DUF883 family membrane-anchored ribosome-binding protein